MAKSLLCYLGLHRWQRKLSDDEPYMECSRCGKFRDVGKYVVPPLG